METIIAFVYSKKAGYYGSQKIEIKDITAVQQFELAQGWAYKEYLDSEIANKQIFAMREINKNTANIFAVVRKTHESFGRDLGTSYFVKDISNEHLFISSSISQNEEMKIHASYFTDAVKFIDSFFGSGNAIIEIAGDSARNGSVIAYFSSAKEAENYIIENGLKDEKTTQNTHFHDWTA